MEKKYIFSPLFLMNALLIVSCSSSYPGIGKVRKKISENISLTDKDFTLEEKQKIDTVTFKKLNDIKYNEITNHDNDISGEMVDGINKFVSTIYNNCKSENKNNFLFSDINLYYSLSNAYKGIYEDEIKEEFDNLLNTSDTLRDTYLPKIFDNLYQENDDGVTKIHNGAFIHCDGSLYNYSQKFVDELTKLKCEAYKYNCDKDDDINKMIEWVNYNTNTPDLLKKEDLDFSNPEYKKSFFFSTMFFEQKWLTTFNKEDNVIETFYQDENTKYNVEYLNHNIGSYYNDFGDYFSIEDDYFNYYTIEYVIPKKSEVSIFDVINLYDVLSKKQPNNFDNFKYVDLFVPKFNYETKVDLDDIIKKSGIVKAYKKNRQAFNNMYDESFTGKSYLHKIYQGNKIALNEDSTKVESYVYVEAGAKFESSGDIGDDLTVRLNRPFVYIIKDRKKVPIFVGHVNIPQKVENSQTNVEI